jgi:hypothetical protein
MVMRSFNMPLVFEDFWYFTYRANKCAGMFKGGPRPSLNNI